MLDYLFHPEEDYPEGYSKLDRAGELCGYRPADVVVINSPCEMGWHCPVCVYDMIGPDGNYDERLCWSEYRMFLWCSECNRDYPTVLCVVDLFDMDENPDGTRRYQDVLERQTAMFLDCLEEARAAGVSDALKGDL